MSASRSHIGPIAAHASNPGSSRNSFEPSRISTAARADAAPAVSAARPVGRDGEQSRARYPDVEGFVERDGQRLFYEVYGDGEETIFFMPTLSLVHSRHWKMQIAYCARHFRVLVMDGLGNGRADRCRDPKRYAPTEFARDCLAVMDATATERAVMASLSTGAQYQFELARLAPERVAGAVFVGPLFPYTLSKNTILTDPLVQAISRSAHLPEPIGWAHMNPVHWRQDHRRFADWFIARCLPEVHSAKPIEDGVGWMLDTDPETLTATVGHRAFLRGRRTLRKLARNLPFPVLVVHGERDKITATRDGRALARLSGGELNVVKGSGHMTHARKPVAFNLALRDFAEDTFGRERTPRDPTVYRPDGRPRALFVSSPICLGHAQRDVAIARELRRLHPDLQVDWLAQDPVTRMLEAEGERIHPASPHLANESKHFESESAEHDLHCFHAIRRMDEIFAANFMLFHDVVREQRYDLWIGNEAWELDYYLHENPREKRTPYAWLSDFVGFLPMDDGDARERHLAACDLAVVQGGLTTSMELTAHKRPFLYFPLRHHFEQNFHVRHRLERYGAGRCMDYDDSPPERIAEAIAHEIGRDVDYRDVEVDGAAIAARHLAALL